MGLFVSLPILAGETENVRVCFMSASDLDGNLLEAVARTEDAMARTGFCNIGSLGQ